MKKILFLFFFFVFSFNSYANSVDLSFEIPKEQLEEKVLTVWLKNNSEQELENLELRVFFPEEVNLLHFFEGEKNSEFYFLKDIDLKTKKKVQLYLKFPEKFKVKNYLTAVLFQNSKILKRETLSLGDLVFREKVAERKENYQKKSETSLNKDDSLPSSGTKNVLFLFLFSIMLIFMIRIFKKNL
jgi:hypothetical protein